MSDLPLSVESNLHFIALVLLRYVIGPQNSRHFLFKSGDVFPRCVGYVSLLQVFIGSGPPRTRQSLAVVHD